MNHRVINKFGIMSNESVCYIRVVTLVKTKLAAGNIKVVATWLVKQTKYYQICEKLNK